MLLAIIPFIADGVAKDWPKAVKTLERTLGSVLANPEKDLRAMVVCQDRPPLKTTDPRYIFFESKYPKPDKEDIMAKHGDKGAKTVEAFDAARDLAPEYVMLVDADDLLSNTLVSYVYQRPNFDAFCMRMGFEWREGSSHFIIRRGFSQACGSAFVWRFNERLFPSWIGRNYSKRICDQGHNHVEAAMDAEGFHVDKISVPKAVYVTGHINHMYMPYHKMTFKRWFKNLALAPWRNRKLTPELKKEFGLAGESTA
jgi:hypothetical protein